MKKQSTLRPMNTQAFAHHERLKAHANGIGSSEAAAAIGLNPHKSQLELWTEKSGRKAPGCDPPCMVIASPAPTDPSGTTAHRCHNGVGVSVGVGGGSPPRVVRHPTLPFMLATAPLELTNDPNVELMEYSICEAFQRGERNGGMPGYVRLQVQHQLAVTGKAAADVAVMAAGHEPEIFRIERDDEAIARLIVLEARFWSYVEAGAPPSADGSALAASALRRWLLPRT